MIRRFFLGALALAASLLAGCDPAFDALPHPPPAEAGCVHPAVGSTCPAPLAPADALAFVQSRAWCPPGAELHADFRPGGDLELACAPPEGGWRVVVGVVAADWGAAFLADDAALVVCDLEGRVDAVLPMLADRTAGRHWHRLSVDDGLCLDAGLCEPAFDPCADPPAA